MPDVLSAVVARLEAVSAVTDLVGSRIYPDVLPQTVAYPAVRVSVLSEMSHHHLGDLSGLAQAVVQVDAFAQTRLAANAVGEAARLALSRYQGTVASTEVRRVMPPERSHEYEPPGDGSDLGRFRHVADYPIFFCEATS